MEAGGRKTPKELFFDYARRYPKDAYKTSPKLFCEFIRSIVGKGMTDEDIKRIAEETYNAKTT